MLDTHAWVWWTTRPDKLSRPQRAAIERSLKDTDAVLWISIISCWEVALLCQSGKLRFTGPWEQWLQEASAVPGLEVQALTLPIVTTAARLRGLRDPADMIIVATAQHQRVRLVTNDTRIAETRLVAVVA
jgi:PIN domain nuclease of toxin-antitoxin system